MVELFGAVVVVGATVVVVVVGATVVVVGATVVVVGLLQVGTVKVSVVLETVPPKARARPVHPTVLPTVIPEASMSVPTNVDGDPSVVAAVGVHQTSQDEAPLASRTAELATDVSAPSMRKMNVPLPVSVMPAVPIEAALLAVVQ